MRVGSRRSQQKSNGVKLQYGNNDGNMRPDHVEADGKGQKMSSNSIGNPGKVPPILLEKRFQDGNNDRHRDPEHFKDTKGG